MVSYDLDLHYRVGTNRLEGTAVIVAVSREELRKFSLDLARLRVSRVTVDGLEGTRFNQASNKLNVTPDDPIAAGDEFVVRVEYGGSPQPRSSPAGPSGWSTSADAASVTGEPIGASTWFPCNDHPAELARYRLRVSAEQDFTVVCSGVLVERTASDGRASWLYESDRPVPTYVMSVQIGLYETVRLTAAGIAVVIAFPAPLKDQVRADFRSIGRMLRFYATQFGPYPLSTFSVVVLESALERPFHAQGLAVFGSNQVDGFGGLEGSLARELAYEWSGCRIGLAAWQDIWISSGFAFYAEWLWSERAGRAGVHERALYVYEQLASLPADLSASDPGIARLHDSRVHARAALTLYALRRAMGDPAFTAALREWCIAYAGKVGSSTDFRALMASRSRIPVESVMDEWLDAERLPEFRA